MSQDVVMEAQFAPEAVAKNHHNLHLSATLPVQPNLQSSIAEVPTSAVGSRFGLRALMSRYVSAEFRIRLRRMAPWLTSGIILGLNLLLHAPLFVVGATIASLTIQIVKSIIKSCPLCQRAWKEVVKRSGIPEHKLPELTAIFASGAWLAAMSPTQALFFDAAEKYVTKLIDGTGAVAATGTAGFVPLIFGFLRVIFCIYIAVALVRVINAFRNDEDWSTAARVPVIVILCVVIGEGLSSMIVT